MSDKLSNENVDALLVEELKRFAESGAGMGWLLNNPLTNAVGLPQSAALGTGWSAKKLKTHSFSDTRSLINMDPHSIIGKLQSIFISTQPRIIESDGNRAYVFSDVVGSGTMNLNPTVIIAMYVDGTDSLSVVAHAKEGFIKQKSSEKAVNRLFEQLAT